MSTATTTRPNPLRVTLLVIGSVLLAAIIGYIVITAVGATLRDDASAQITFADSTFDSVDVTTEIADITVEFADVDAAEVTFAQNDERRSMSFDADVQGSTLVVTVVDRGMGWWIPFNFTEGPRLTIVLPESFDDLDLTMDTDVGDAIVSGDFATIDLVSTVGDIRVSGSADTADIETTVGDLTAKRYTVGEFTIDSSTGDVNLDLATVPSALAVTSNIGDQDVTLPRGSYRVLTSTNVGDVRVEVDEDSGSSTVLTFETTVGDIRVRN